VNDQTDGYGHQEGKCENSPFKKSGDDLVCESDKPRADLRERMDSMTLASILIEQILSNLQKQKTRQNISEMEELILGRCSALINIEY